MWESRYGKEPADLKLLAIQFYRKIGIVLLAVLLGAVIAGSAYFVKNVILAPAPVYKAHAVLYVDFVMGTDGKPMYYTYNTAGWSGFVKTDEIMDRALTYLQEEAQYAEILVPIEKAELIASTDASVDADYRVIDLTVTNADPDRAVMISHAVEKAFLDFGESMQEIDKIRVMTTADGAERILVDTYTYRAVIWGGLLAGILMILLFAVAAVLDEAIYVPITFERRYGIPMLGVILSGNDKGKKEVSEDVFPGKRLKELKAMTDALCMEEKERAFVCVDPHGKETISQIEEMLKETTLQGIAWIEDMLENPEEIIKISQYEEVILIIEAGRQNGKRIEYTIAQVEKGNCKVKAAILIGADKKLLKSYYFGKKG